MNLSPLEMCSQEDVVASQTLFAIGAIVGGHCRRVLPGLVKLSQSF
jgi:hypothetical protein